ncbi:hypothetical protein SmJEL517_g02232 [Synchytrium microbalum]|uniref:Chromosome transmission fidelity protein 8 n=1 Tax=Synchytrium microbalum TaxID=1806994 RepID=A0A507CCK6_9FUNG|nr:uncharacterized protein SmJEL517_g02232 [Synchytrium microbalum]TPX35273.1 hypothetical protein SmJEL517_g02232 [Synchytrium microbalum]
MIIIPTIELHGQGSESRDWILLEVQGSLEIDDDTLQNAVLGSMQLNKDCPVLTIGHHRLEGKRITLSKPLALIRRKEIKSIWSSKNSAAASRSASRPTSRVNSRASSPVRTHNISNDVDGDAMDVDQGGGAQTMNSSQTTVYGGMAGSAEEVDPFAVTPEWETVCVIRYKYIFSQRPETTVRQEHRGAVTFRKLG